jgi:hypothetical protein
LLEIESRETRMNAVFNASAKVATDKLIGWKLIRLVKRPSAGG